jgi:hypothetical protein
MIERLELENRIQYQLNGKTHKTNGPAVILHSGNRWSWWLNGKLHRYYGPFSKSGDWILHDECVKIGK